MFYFQTIQNQIILKSDFVNDIDAFFTTKKTKNALSLYPNIIIPEQTHSDNVEIVDDRQEYPNTDALILTKKNTAIALKFADCTPIILYDKEHNLGAIVHAGWRGTSKKITIKTIDKMHKEFHTEPNKIIAIIGPAIGMCCYEVSEEVKEMLLQTVTSTIDICNQNFVNLKEINAHQLRDIGVTSIDICPYCTSCNNDLFYSYRKENKTIERHYAILRLLQN